VLETQNNLHGLIKWVYSSLFDWVVRKVNFSHKAMASAAAVKFIGILDLFGFEILASNSFEQLCINLANERLQQHFNEHIFVSEQEEYQRQGVDCSFLTYSDNQSVIDLICKKPTGLFSILEEHAMLNRGEFILISR